MKSIRKLHLVLPIQSISQIRYRYSTTSNSNSNNEGTLKGIRVLDLTRVLAGPFCTMILGDLGAEIIKVEKPGVGDDTRSWGPPYKNNLSCYFISINRNKKSIAIDLKKGHSLVQELAKKSDILIENFLPGTLSKFGLGYEQLKTESPGLIYCSISGYGQDGPYKTRGGYDVIAGSIGGLLHITGEENGPPCKVGVAMTDLSTGLYAHGAILAALLERSKTGQGQYIDCNLLSTQISCLVNLSSNYLNGGQEARRLGSAHESIVPYQSFVCQDLRYITIGCGNNQLFSELCDNIDLPELKGDLDYSTNELRVKNRVELVKKISDKIKTKTCEEWLDKFKNCKFPYGPINNMKYAFEDPQVKHNKMVQEYEGYRLVNPAVKYNRGGNYIRSSPPYLGQHTREILKSLLHLSDNDIEKLVENSIIA